MYFAEKMVSEQVGKLRDKRVGNSEIDVIAADYVNI
jgi:hypothetical protein